MIQSINVGNIYYDQEAIIKNSLKLQHLIILSYLHQFFSSGNALFKTKPSSNEKYYLITLNKILSDLPFLNIKKRRLQELIHDLETAKILNRYSEERHCPNIYLSLNLSSVAIQT